MTDETIAAPRIVRTRHELRRRNLTVAATERLTPHMIRLTLSGEDLHDFVSTAPDDHMKLVLNADSDSPQMRDYTPRRFSASELVVDVVDHTGGPAADWARAAVQGDAITIVGVPDAADEQTVTTAADWTAHWLHRPLDQATDPAPYLAALDAMPLGPRTFIWMAAEAMVARAIRTHLLDRGHDRQWIKASGYWVAGQADASDKGIED